MHIEGKNRWFSFNGSYVRECSNLEINLFQDTNYTWCPQVSLYQLKAQNGDVTL